MAPRAPTWLHDPAPGRPCTVIGEVAQAHDGSLGMAHAFIDAIALAGADAVKFQTHIAAAESTPAEPWRTRFSPQDDTRYAYWRRMEFNEEQWRGLKRHADERDLLFLSSPFSPEATALLGRVGVAGWKIASGEITNSEMLDAAASSKHPVMLSTGMSDLAEIDGAVARLRAGDAPLAILQCSSLYPTPAEHVGLGMLSVFRERYGCAVGLSDHSATIYPGIAAATLGAQILEVHVTLSRQMFGPDVVASLTTAELSQLVEGVRFVERMHAAPYDKQAIADGMREMRTTFMKSVVAARDLPAGMVLRLSDLALKKPGTGIAAADIGRLIDRVLCRPVARDARIAEADLEPAP